MAQLKNMGSLEQMLSLMPGVKPGALKDAKIDEKALAHMEAIILSMTKKERMKPEILDFSRKKRIAAGSGTSVEEINKILKQFDQTKLLMKHLKGNKGKLRLPF